MSGGNSETMTVYLDNDNDSELTEKNEHENENHDLFKVNNKDYLLVEDAKDDLDSLIEELNKHHDFVEKCINCLLIPYEHKNDNVNDVSVDGVLFFRYTIVRFILSDSHLEQLFKNTTQALISSYPLIDKANEHKENVPNDENDDNDSDGDINNTGNVDNMNKIKAEKPLDLSKLTKLNIPYSVGVKLLDLLVKSKTLNKLNMEEFKLDTKIIKNKETDLEDDSEHNETECIINSEEQPIGELSSSPKKTLDPNHDFIKICIIMKRIFMDYYNCYFGEYQKVANEPDLFSASINSCIEDNPSFFQEVAKVKNIAGYIDNINNINCADGEFKEFTDILNQAKVKLVIRGNSLTTEIKLSKSVLFWVLLGLLIAGLMIFAISAVNYFVFTFWAAAATETAATLSMAIPGGVALLSFIAILLIVLLLYENYKQKEVRQIVQLLNPSKLSKEINKEVEEKKKNELNKQKLKKEDKKEKKETTSTPGGLDSNENETSENNEDGNDSEPAQENEQNKGTVIKVEEEISLSESNK